MLPAQDHHKIYHSIEDTCLLKKQKKQAHLAQLKQQEVDNNTYIDHTSKHAFITSQNDRTFDARIHKNSIPGMITDQEKLDA